MTRLNWDDISSRRYQVGVDRVVFYNSTGIGEAWNGVVSISEDSDDKSQSAIHLDGLKLVNRMRYGSFSGTIESFTTPYELTSYPPKTFGLCYRVLTESTHILHLVYNAKPVMAAASHTSMSDTPELLLYSWDFTTQPISTGPNRRTSHLILDFTDTEPDLVSEIEDALYGTYDEQARLPGIDEILAIYESHAVLKITDNGDGTWTAEGPDEVVIVHGDGSFTINWASVEYLSDVKFRVSSL